MPDFTYENSYGDNIICGIDEAGRGPLAGPVIAACVQLDYNKSYLDIDDSKKLSAKTRKLLYHELINSQKYAIGHVNHEVIDKINILEATKLAMFEAYKNFTKKYQIFPTILLIDGNIKPFDNCDDIADIKTIIKGDQKSLSIAAASIIAKEYRDIIMNQFHKLYPNYGFDRHKGYPTKNHIANIKQYGIIDIHRKSFGPIKKIYYANY